MDLHSSLFAVAGNDIGDHRVQRLLSQLVVLVLGHHRRPPVLIVQPVYRPVNPLVDVNVQFHCSHHLSFLKMNSLSNFPNVNLKFEHFTLGK